MIADLHSHRDDLTLRAATPAEYGIATVEAGVRLLGSDGSDGSDEPATFDPRNRGPSNAANGPFQGHQCPFGGDFRLDCAKSPPGSDRSKGPQGLNALDAGATKAGTKE